MVAHGIVTARLDYRSGLLYGASAGNFDRLRAAQNALARAVCQAPVTSSANALCYDDCCSCTCFPFDSVLKINWLPLHTSLVNLVFWRIWQHFEMIINLFENYTRQKNFF